MKVSTSAHGVLSDNSSWERYFEAERIRGRELKSRSRAIGACAVTINHFASADRISGIDRILTQTFVKS